MTEKKAEKKQQSRLIWILIGLCLFSISVVVFDWLDSSSGNQLLTLIGSPFGFHGQPEVLAGTNSSNGAGSGPDLLTDSGQHNSASLDPNATTGNALAGNVDGHSNASSTTATGSGSAATIRTDQANGLSVNGNETDGSGAVRIIPIYLVGAIGQPGIYQVAAGSYLYQLVEKAGGLTDDAAAEQINLALQLNTNQLIHIPTRAEWAAAPTFNVVGEGNSDGTPAKVNINQADVAAFDTLPGIGPATAKTIIDYRTKNGPFRQLEDLMKIPGIKQSRFEAIRDLITLG